MENQQEKSQEEMVKEAVEEAKKAAAEQAEKEEESADTAKAGEAKEEAGAADDSADEGTAPEEPGDAGEAADGEAPDEEPAEDESAEDEAEDGKSDVKKSRGFFGKKNKKDKKDEKIEELTDKLTRQMAEFDNFRKRTEREKSQMYEIGAKDIIEKILPVVDNFERGLGAVGDDNKEDAFVQGMEKVYKQLMTTLEGIGVKPIEAAGQQFNPDFHNAVMHVEDESLGENIVAEEFQKGYMYRDSVVRHSMVKVAN